MSRGRLIIISAPAGTGKTTLAHKLMQAHPGSIVQSISCTTRKKRAGEKDGKDYYFLDRKDFEHRKETGDFLESAEVFGNLYGTLRKDVEDLLDHGKHVLLVIDVQGAMQLRDEPDALLIFLKPPSIEVLKERLTGRQTETEETLKKRLSRAKEELQMATKYDHVIVNDDLDVAFHELNETIQKEIYDKRSADE